MTFGDQMRLSGIEPLVAASQRWTACNAPVPWLLAPSPSPYFHSLLEVRMEIGTGYEATGISL